MKSVLLIFTITVVIFSCRQQEKRPKSSLDKTLESVTSTTESTGSDSIVNISVVEPNGERFLRFEFQVDTPVAEVWKAFTTEEGMKTWMTPVVKLNFKVGGKALTNYDKNAKVEDKGTIPLGITNYVPHELLTYKVTLNDVFPEKCRNEDQDLQEIVQFHSIGPNQTRVVSTMLGWGEGKEWNETYSFFEKGNKWSYDQLIKRFKSGPVKW